MPFVKQQFVVAQTPVSFDTVGAAGYYFTAGATSTYTVTGTHSAAGGSKNVVLLFVDAETNGQTAAATITATYNGVPMTALTVWNYGDDGSGDFGNIAAFYLFNPPTGTQNVATTVSTTAAGDYFITANTVSYNNVGSLGSIVTNFSTDGSVSPTLTVPNATNGMVSMMFGDPSAAGGFGTFSGFNKTSRFNNTTDSVGAYMMIGDAKNTPNITFTASQSWSLPWGAIGVPLIP